MMWLPVTLVSWCRMFQRTRSLIQLCQLVQLMCGIHMVCTLCHELGVMAVAHSKEAERNSTWKSISFGMVPEWCLILTVQTLTSCHEYLRWSVAGLWCGSWGLLCSAQCLGQAGETMWCWWIVSVKRVLNSPLDYEMQGLKTFTKQFYCLIK